MIAAIEIPGVDWPYRVTTTVAGDEPAEAVVVLDANLLYGMAVDLVRLMRIPALVPPVVVVGVGYPTDDLAEFVRRRTIDFTPSSAPGWPDSGGGEHFRATLRDHVLPFISSTAPTVRAVTLFGHSLGGMFTVTDWLADDHLFDRYVISSPSLWWNDHALLRTAARVPAAPAYLAIGSEETDDGRRREAAALADGDVWKPPPEHLDMVADLQRFVAGLTPVPGHGEPAVEVIAGEFHATAPPIAFSRGLRHLLGECNT